ncbi:MAG: RsmD family RNA methyltransferase [Candidatus Caldarchaeum sp.]|nr:RsmD family RNA methyltransferase [Candidatus Caldarchaeum sp.]
MRTFFLLSGENPALSASELKHLLETLGNTSLVYRIDDRIVISDVNTATAREIVQRAAYTKLAGQLVSEGVSLDQLVFEPGWEGKLPPFKSFDVSVYKIGGAQANSVDVEKRVAAEVIANVRGARVNLTKPDVSFFVAVSPKICLVGLGLAVKPKKFFADRKAGKRPFKIPSALQPKLARCLVNLSIRSQRSRILDPFAGSGAVVVEAGLMGHEAVGLELKTWISNGMRKNVYTYSPSNCHVIQGDAKRLPFTRAFDSVATDPPYGRSATLGGTTFKNLIKEFSEAAVKALEEKARMAITVPRTHFSDLLEACSIFKPVEYHDLYVHKSLTRRVVVMVLE